MWGLRANQSSWEPTETDEATVRSPYRGAHDKGTEVSFLLISSPPIPGGEVRPASTRLHVSLCSNQLAHKRKVGSVWDAPFVLTPPIRRPRLHDNVSNQDSRVRKTGLLGV